MPTRLSTGRAAGRHTEKYGAMATPLEGAEWHRWWSVLKQTYPFFADHEQKTDRTIPVVALTRA